MEKPTHQKKHPLKILLASLKPILQILFIFGVLATALVGYDQYKTYLDRQKGAELIDQILTNASCDGIVNSGEDVAFKIVVENKNSEGVLLKSLHVSPAFLRKEDNEISSLKEVKPKAAPNTETPSTYQQYDFQDPVQIEPAEDTTIQLAFSTKEASEAGANPHTIVVYNGEINLLFNYDMEISIECRYQVRYS